MELVNLNKLGRAEGRRSMGPHESSRDEARHAMMLKGLLERFFK